MEFAIVLVLALLAVAAAAGISSRIGVAAPLILVLLGIGVSFLPFVPAVEVEPEWILTVVLPPLLYSASASMPTTDFRRELRAIGGLAVTLVVLSSVLLGLLFTWLIPGLGLGWGIALGAVVSPTDAVATSIVKRLGVAPRAVSVLEGEGLLNDATALVLLRSAIAGAAGAVSLWGVAGDFLFAVVVAVAIGAAVGWVTVRIRARVSNTTAATVLSFTVPFLASVPTEALGASGLVAAVVAGLVTGAGRDRRLTAQQRLADRQNWRTVEFVLEGGIFLLMGLELFGIVEDVEAEHLGVGPALAVAAAGLVAGLLVRAAFVAPLVWRLQRRARRGERMRPRLSEWQERLDRPTDELVEDFRARTEGTRRRPPSARGVERFRTRLRRTVADIDFFLAEPVGWREGTVIVWAGMRGAVSVAAVQTLPADAPDRPVLVLVAFAIAAASLLLQGSTLPRVIRWVRPAGPDPEAQAQEREDIRTLMQEVAASVPEPDVPAGIRRPGRPTAAALAQPDEEDRDAWELLRRHRLAVLEAQRTALLDVRDDGVVSAAALDAVLTAIDAEQIGLELQGAPAD
ncbi:cation:proton antiporter [Nakamurella leprariae]|uniref:Cation:proton antiporter n=1 Tax=Nakamurella leprariae TaxID=2803911 RepID=A0A938Y6A0_9ACTN|nr:cation:proton antiporter [Nakamurella leprariae]MBM9466816.1 cation:proton antiporter [Nakamurella leprariae]